ncbi:MAG: CPBP family intramembrane metalloprotease [Clostridia bacterium]|nr:CPBP family intramembrane metalloprotease [Clostridia bacterium]
MKIPSKYKDWAVIAIILISCVLTAVFDFVELSVSDSEIYNKLVGNILPLLFGTLAVTLLVWRSGANLFQKPQKLLYIIPCLIIAVDNFPFAAYFAGKMQLLHTDAGHFLLFGLYCLFVGVFEELIFRGIVFQLLCERFSKDKRGLLKTYFLSSVLFGCMHLLNLFAGAGIGQTLLQVGYSTLTGGLFAFALLKTKNILIPAATHALYNFCGLLFTAELGLGSGSVIDLPTALVMLIVSLIISVFVLYKTFTYPEEEREVLYSRLGIESPIENK